MGGDQEPHPDKCPKAWDGGGQASGSHLCGWMKVILRQPEALHRNDMPSQVDGRLKSSQRSLDQESSPWMMRKGSQSQSMGRALGVGAETSGTHQCPSPVLIKNVPRLHWECSSSILSALWF